MSADQTVVLAPEPVGRIAPRAELVNIPEFEEMARRSLAPSVFNTVAGGDRLFFERITFRPRMMVPTTNMDLSVDLFGQKMFAPIIAGPISDLQKYHPDGEAGLVRAAAAAKTTIVTTGEPKAGLWHQVFLNDDPAVARTKIDQAVKAGCKAICITVSAPMRARPAAAQRPVSWETIDSLRRNVNIPVLLKGIMTPEEADVAIRHGIQGIVVSNYGGLLAPGMAPPMAMLPSVAERVAGRVPILIDGGFRRGSDIFKALAFGATAVLVARPLAWGLAAYGPEGAQQVLEMLQTELARVFAHMGKVTPKEIDRTTVRLHNV